ncbi:MAG: flagellar basal body-associated FliL family protein [Syntrophales bacterium]|jgi:flagellar basal body-associated protein FliL|nr:flagellar basal body-associated FliL family protein [Syntrophales bacterium]
MTKKVSLDTLDIEEPTISTNERGLKEEEQPQKPPARWYRSRLFIISGAVFFVLVCTGLALFFFMGAPREASRPAPQAVSHGAAGAPGKVGVIGRPGIIVEEVKDFLIPLKEGNRDIRILSMDLVLEMDSARQGLFQEKVVLIRGAIYKAVNGTAAEITRSKEGIEKVRAIIIDSLETLLGKGFVKNVWVTKFVVL